MQPPMNDVIRAPCVVRKPDMLRHRQARDTADAQHLRG
jgi:hypothetical protein